MAPSIQSSWTECMCLTYLVWMASQQKIKKILQVSMHLHARPDRRVIVAVRKPEDIAKQRSDMGHLCTPGITSGSCATSTAGIHMDELVYTHECQTQPPKG